MRFLKVNVRRIFVTGVFIVLPALVTYFLLTFLFGKVNQYVTPHLRRLLGFLPGYEEIAPWVNPLLPVVAVVIILAVVFLVGLIGTNYLGKRLINGFHNLMLQIPLVKGIYGSAKQLFDAFNMPGTRAFEEVCLIEYPRRGLYCLGFVTRRSEGEIQAITKEETAYVFLPTTPNPTSGYLLVVPRSEIHVLDMSAEEGLKLIVSGGMFSPIWRRGGTKAVEAGRVALTAPAGKSSGDPTPPREGSS